MLSKNVTAVSKRGDETWRRGAGGRKYTTVCFFFSHHCRHTHVPTHSNAPERHRAVVSWQTNDRQMTCWNTSTGPDSNRPARLCQWHLLWREACVSFYTNKTSAKHQIWLLPPPSTVSNLIRLSIWVAGTEDMVKGSMMERWDDKEGAERWICWNGQGICKESCGSILACLCLYIL